MSKTIMLMVLIVLILGIGIGYSFQNVSDDLLWNQNDKTVPVDQLSDHRSGEDISDNQSEKTPGNT